MLLREEPLWTDYLFLLCELKLRFNKNPNILIDFDIFITKKLSFQLNARISAGKSRNLWLTSCTIRKFNVNPITNTIYNSMRLSLTTKSKLRSFRNFTNYYYEQ